MKIDNREIGPNFSPFIIAEIGINHEGNIDKAIKMIDDASQTGCDCVKFQTHVINDEMIPNNVIPGNAEESIWDIMNRCALTEDEDKQLFDYTKSKGLIYLSTPFSRAASIRLEKMGVSAYKIGSGECNNYPLIKHIAGYRKPIILSTGMNDIESIKPAVKIMEKANIEYALLHCTSMYPTPYDKVRLGGINDLTKNFPNAIIGLSDHSIGNYTSFAGVALGASIIEKHFTSDKYWDGPDIPISVDPIELKDLVIGAKAVQLAKGGCKEIIKEEQPTIDFAYASVVSIKDIKKGEKFNHQNIWVKRPGTGEIKAKDYEKIINKIATKNINKDKQISWRDIQD
ncbi:MAG: polyhydroxyalkanoate biosynthesis repressor PhaR [Candidatus Marinimicrobia bacterium]|nr:polyhydroxyalkanoate biosynthesis repressor PhaR [Candidatus Neomarinimicrobiota bacterium]|tara:strand:+ start:2018 stop:3043 length:1026 start_codon:yes stop_codon:yes gene_type:complete